MALCGCWYPVQGRYRPEKQYLPQVNLISSTKILGTSSQRTQLQQTFVNPTDQKLDEVKYTFPLYDGVSVVGFTCKTANKVLVGVVKEKNQARADYNEAVAKGETAGLLEQLPDASDAFNTTVGNVAANEKIIVEITYLGELKHDAETDGTRFTIPTIIAPRYGAASYDTTKALDSSGTDTSGGIQISVDVELEKGSVVRGLQSPSHPIAVTMGRTAAMEEDAYETNIASAQLALDKAELGKDFVIVVLSKDPGVPQALLEAHPTIAGQRAIMTTLVPKFDLPKIVPEIVFVVDRSGSMDGKIAILVNALKVFLKSLPVTGVKFNICSFGSRHSFLFKQSQTYSESSLEQALKHVSTFKADFGGTEMLAPVKDTCAKRYKDMSLEVMLLTDGQIWNQQELFSFIKEQPNTRFFSLGIGSGASSALVEGIARAGGGFAQFVDENEKMEKRLVRMLKAALTPHITDYKLIVNYAAGDDDFEMVVPSDTSKARFDKSTPLEEKKTISLYDTAAPESSPPSKDHATRFDALPDVTVPTVLQAPHKLPALYPFNRTTVYLLLSSSEHASNPESITLRGTSPSGTLELSIPILPLTTPGETFHQLAAKRAVQELEQCRGWLYDVKTKDGKTLKEAHEGNWDLMVERECVRLGEAFQIASKHTSFVAVERGASNDGVEKTHEIVAPERSKPHTSHRGQSVRSSSKELCAMSPPQMASRASAFWMAPSYAPSASPSGGGLFGSALSAPMAMMAQAAPAPIGARLFGGRAPPPPPPPPSTGGGWRSREASGGDRAARKYKSAVPDVTPMGMDCAMAMPVPPESDDEEDAIEGAAMEMAPEHLAPLPNDVKMQKLIEMQRFDGSWAATEALWKVLVVFETSVRAKVSGVGAGTDVDSGFLATVAAVAWLKAKMKGEEEVWEMVVEKAMTWLEGQGGQEDWIKEVMALF